MSNQPLVSVFLPTYNQQNFIAASIESVVSQDYENLEIVIGDDCSQDDTWRIVQEYQNRYPEKIKAFRNPKNLGITGNCNEILKRCTGRYVVFTAGDDLFLPGKISTQVNTMSGNESIVLCYHNVEVFLSENNETLYYWNSNKNKPISGYSKSVVKELIKSRNSIIAGMSVMVKRENIPSAGYDTRIPIASDWFMWIQVLSDGGSNGRVEYIPSVMSRYRRHKLNITDSGFMDIDDLYITLAIAENKYPKLIQSIDHCRSIMRYSRGIRLLINGSHNDARDILKISPIHIFRDWKYIYWLSASYLPILLKLRNK